MRTEDERMIYKCLHGEPEAFGFLVDEYKESVYAFAFCKLRNFHDAEDVTQEVFIRAYRKMHTLRRWDDLPSWLYAITNNLCKNWIRANSRRPDRNFIEDESPCMLDRHSMALYQENRSSESLHESIQEALDSLPEIYRQVLVLHYLGNMNSFEIASFLGMAPGSIRERLTRARKMLKEEMLTMIGATFDMNKLRVGFTFRIVEMARQIRVPPISAGKSLPWGFSLAAGIITLIFGFGAYINLSNTTDYSPNSASSRMLKVLNIGEYPVETINVSDVSALANESLNGNGSGFTIPSLQNALFVAPQAEGGTWTKKANMPTARGGISTCVLNDKIYAIGGGSANGYTPTTEEYDPSSDTWAKRNDMPTTRGDASASAVDGRIYVMGGYGQGQPVEFSTVEEYDPKSDKWKRKSDMPTGRQFFSTQAVDGKIYAIGGWRDAKELSIVEEYDPEKDEWTKKKSMPNARFDFASSVVNGKIYIMGGYPIGGGIPMENDREKILSTVEEYDPKTDIWTKKADMPTPRLALSASSVNGKIYAIGGWDGSSYLAVVEEYDPIIDKWQRKTDIPSQRIRSSASAINGKIYIIGGIFRGGTFASTVEEYDPEGGKSINLKGKLPATWGEAKIALNK